MNKLIENLLLIDEILHDMNKFPFIKINIEGLDTENIHYKELVNQTDLLIKVLEAFSKPL